ncbi:hypothetical protein [Halovenus sp. HT40]|uniref:hypothetical protein n=1 Tax=Halovenus sp. HT40 TaxID=3126691 RepID=UPI00300E9082
MNISYDDKLAVLGLVAGGYLLITLLGTFIGLPWATAASPLVGVVQTVGILLSIVLVALLVLVTQGYDLEDIRALN